MSIADVWLGFTLFIMGTGISVWAVIQINAYLRMQRRRNGNKKEGRA